MMLSLMNIHTSSAAAKRFDYPTALVQGCAR
jgi:hypothetical protein